MPGSKKKSNAPKKKGMSKVRSARMSNVDMMPMTAKKGSRKSKAR